MMLSIQPSRNGPPRLEQQAPSRAIRHIDADDIDFNRESATAVFPRSVTNVARRSGATEVRLEIARDGSSCMIVDNDRGYSSDKRSARSSFGLLGMRERVALGGDLQIQSAPAEGFALVALPLTVIEGKEGN
jgi:two-component system, NarL family, sensor histidine kinase UhpB